MSALFGRFHWQDMTCTHIGMPDSSRRSAGYAVPLDSRNYVFGYTHAILGPNSINDARIGVNTFLTDAVNYWYENGTGRSWHRLPTAFRDSTTTLLKVSQAFLTFRLHPQAG